MTPPLQYVAMGLLVVALNVTVNGYDLIADPLGWLVFLFGALPLRRVLPGGETLVGFAGLAGAVSVVLFVPWVRDQLSASGQWAVSVPQTVVLIVVCNALASAAEAAADPIAGRFRILRTAFIVLLFAPAVVLGGNLPTLVPVVAVVAVLALLYCVYLLFRVSKREWLVPEQSPDPAA
ncbi:MAG: hypothetical protein QOF35_191 [Actinomycetota bacterium]|nr:hypothetical protein [Actinomycetota bacterium]